MNAFERTIEDNYRMRIALERIERWFGEFPEVKDSNGKVTSYAVAYGSNGERDFIRTIARKALSPAEG